MSRSPRRRIRLVTVVGGFLRSFKPGWVWMITADLAPATGVRTTRFCRTLETSFVLRALQYRSRGSTRPATALRADALASTTSHPAFVTIAKRPSGGHETAELVEMICPTAKAEYFSLMVWTDFW